MITYTRVPHLRLMMATILPVANKTVLMGSSEYQSLLDGVRIINLELEKKEDAVLTAKSKIIYGLYWISVLFVLLLIHISDPETVKHYSLGLHCTTCQTAFELFEEHRAHYKSEWHRYNLKQKIRKRQTIDESEFLALESIVHLVLC